MASSRKINKGKRLVGEMWYHFWLGVCVLVRRVLFSAQRWGDRNGGRKWMLLSLCACARTIFRAGKIGWRGKCVSFPTFFPSTLFRGKIDFLSDRQEEKLVPRFGICPINISPVPKLGKRGRKKVGNKEKARKRPPIQIFSSRSFPSKKKGGERKRENEK